jgi:threonine/homoserine/homoserine lactone efflux protein
MTARLLTFVGVVTLLTITPGPDMALVTRVMFGHGRTAAWRTSLGVVTGHLVWGTASALGVAAILNASATLYGVLRLAGAAYLIWLGLSALLARAPAQASAATARTTPAAVAGAYRQGLANDLLNPKIGVFYTTLLPQFIAPGQPVILTSLLLAATFAAIVALWLAIYVALLARAGALFQGSALQRGLERATGVVLIGLGLRLATEQR